MSNILHKNKTVSNKQQENKRYILVIVVHGHLANTKPLYLFKVVFIILFATSCFYCDTLNVNSLLTVYNTCII